MFHEILNEEELQGRFSNLFLISKEENVDYHIVNLENVTRKLMAQGKLSIATMEIAMHAFLYFGRIGIARAVLRNLERAGKTPTTEALKQILHGPADDQHKAVKALYLIKHGQYDEKFSLKAATQAAFAALPLAACESILDGACGTGLAGPALRRCGFAGSLVGVDISEHMLAKAHAKGCYDTLVVSGIVEYLEARADAFDVILLIDLAPHLDHATLRRVVGLAHRALRDGGHLLLNAPIVAADSRGLAAEYGLHRSSTAQVDQMLQDAGFLAGWVDEQEIETRQYSAWKSPLQAGRQTIRLDGLNGFTPTTS